MVVVGPVFFKIMVSCPLIYFPVAPVSALSMIVLQDLFNTTCLYDMNLGAAEVISVEFNKIFLLIFFDTFGIVPHRHSLHI